MTVNPFLSTGINDPSNDGIKLSSDPRPLDEITGVDKIPDPPKAKVIHRDENGITTDENGVKRSSDGHLVKGTAQLKKRKDDKKALKKYMSMMIQGKGDRLIDELWKMALYDPDLAEEQHKERHKVNAKPPTFKPWITPSIKMEAIKLLAAYDIGTPAQKIERDENVNVNVNYKATHIAKLIHQNKDRLKLIQGGMDEDIIDVEVVND